MELVHEDELEVSRSESFSVGNAPCGRRGVGAIDPLGEWGGGCHTVSSTVFASLTIICAAPDSDGDSLGGLVHRRTRSSKPGGVRARHSLPRT